MVQAHLGRLAGLAGPALGVAADGGDPAGVGSELVRDILAMMEEINSRHSARSPAGFLPSSLLVWGSVRASRETVSLLQQLSPLSDRRQSRAANQSGPDQSNK